MIETTSRAFKKDIHKSPDGILRRCVASACPFSEAHVSLRSLAMGGGAQVYLDGHSSQAMNVTEVIDGVFAVAGGQRSRTFRLDGSKLSPVEARAWRRKHDIDPRASGLRAAPIQEPTTQETEEERSDSYRSVTELAAFDEREWFEKPWKERKERIEEAAKHALKEVDDAFLYQVGRWGGWNRRSTALGITKHYFNDGTSEIELSDPLLRSCGPKQITNTILHEIAHSVSTFEDGHGSVWQNNFRTILDHFSLEDYETSRTAGKMTDLELEALKRQHVQKRWMGICANNPEHKFYNDGKPRNTYLCAKVGCADLASDSREITYQHNPDYRA